MYENYPEIPIEDLSVLADRDFASLSTEKYILCLRVNNESIYNNIYLGALIIDFKAAESKGKSKQLREVLISLSDKDGFHELAQVPDFISLDIFNPYTPDGKIHYGGSISAG